MFTEDNYEDLVHSNEIITEALEREEESGGVGMGLNALSRGENDFINLMFIE